MIEVRLLDLDHLAYTACWSLMQRLVEAKHQGDWPEILFLVEHEPVLTLGRRGKENDVLAPLDELTAKGIALHRVERGGLVTYHGPGQLVAYPVFNLKKLRLGVSQMVWSLEEAAIGACAELGVAAGRQKGHPGVWSNGRKLASLGLAVRHGITFHGLALNNNPDLSHFSLINPCGLGTGIITSLAEILGAPVAPRRLRLLLATHLSRVLGLEMMPWTLGEAYKALEEHDGSSAQAGLAPA